MKTTTTDSVLDVFIIRCPVCESFNSIFSLTTNDHPIEWHCEDCGSRLKALPGEELFRFISRVRRLSDSI